MPLSHFQTQSTWVQWDSFKRNMGGVALLVVVLDEFNELANDQIRRDIAETIKYLSDRGSPATVVLIGVADDVNELIDDHRSIERCLAQVNMPRMFAMNLRILSLSILPERK